VALHRRRHDDAAPARHLRGPLGQCVAGRRGPAPDHGAGEGGAVHGQGGGGGLRDRSGRRLPARRPARPVPASPAWAPAVGRRVADDSNPHRRSDGRRLGEPEASGQPQGLGSGRPDRRLPHLLPGHGEHDPRPRVGRPPGARADAELRGGELADPVEAPLPRRLAVHLRGPQGGRHGERRRRADRRAPVVDPERARRADHQLQPVLHDRAARPLGDQRDRRRAGHFVLPDRRDRREADRSRGGA